MGDLHFNSDGVPIILLGHHILYGKAMPLEKPFVLLRKEVTKIQENKIPIDDLDEEGVAEEKMDTEVFQAETKTKTNYSVIAVIRRKLLFNKRPRPIVYVESKGRN